MADDSTTYGPAQERHTHTPIHFINSGSDMGGYIGANPLSIIQALPLLLQNPSSLKDILSKGTINVNPTIKDNDVNSTLRHEAIHATQAQSPVADKMAELVQKIPGFATIAGAVNKYTGGDTKYLPDETMAYAGENDPRVNIPQDVRNSYVGQLVDQLMKIDPSTAKTYQALAAGK